jgi:SAM-dependent methyltransferase
MEKFISEDQLIMSNASNYKAYLFSFIKPYIKGNILEIGSGIGNITEEIINSGIIIDAVTCIEQDAGCLEYLKEKFAETDKIKLNFIQGSFPQKMKESLNLFDMIFHFNVLEHIQNDVEALNTCFNLLKKGGNMIIYVPAFKSLYGSMDENLHHYRRYSASGLSKKLKDAGFEIVYLKYCNISGFFGWFINNRVLKIQSQKSGQVSLFDKVILPLQQFLEKFIPMPFGQNIAAVVKKP